VFGVPEDVLAQLKRSCAAMEEAFATGGQTKVARYILDHIPRPEATTGLPESAAASIQLAVFYGRVGDLGAAFEHLDRALDARDPALVHLAVAPQWDRLRGDPRFDDRLARMGLVPRRS